MAVEIFPPPGGDENKGPLILAIMWVECTIAILLVCARTFTRVHLVHNLGLDDWTMILSMASKQIKEHFGLKDL